MIIKLDKGKGWAARPYWRDANGEKQSTYKSGFRTKAAAQAWDEKTLSEMMALPEPGAPAVVTLSQLQEDYIIRLERKGAAPRTVEYYEASGRAYLPILGDMPAADITPLQVQQAVDAMCLKADGTVYRSATVRGFYRAMRAVLNYGVKMGVMVSCPCKGIDLPAEEEHEAMIYSGEELGRLLGALKAQEHELYWPVSLCARYGLRRGEALGVRWQDIDFETGLLNVRANLTKTNSAAFLKRAKTRSSETTVVLGDDFLSELRALQGARQRAGTYKLGAAAVKGVTNYADLDPKEFVCLNEKGKPFHPDGIIKRLHTFQAANGLPLSGWHDLRHSYGTLLAEAGVDVATISKAMRHSNVSITSNQYIKGTTGLKRKATEMMAGIIKMPGAPENV